MATRVDIDFFGDFLATGQGGGGKGGHADLNAEIGETLVAHGGWAMALIYGLARPRLCDQCPHTA